LILTNTRKSTFKAVTHYIELISSAVTGSILAATQHNNSAKPGMNNLGKVLVFNPQIPYHFGAFRDIPVLVNRMPSEKPGALLI
jgi:hypothetical protein